MGTSSGSFGRTLTLEREGCYPQVRASLHFLRLAADAERLRHSGVKRLPREPLPCLAQGAFRHGGVLAEPARKHRFSRRMGSRRRCGGTDRGSVIDCANVAPSQRHHPTEKPVDLLRTIIDAAPGETVLDPFMGSGSTCGRVFHGKAPLRRTNGRLNRRWFDVAVERINRMTADGQLLRVLRRRKPRWPSDVGTPGGP